MGQSLEYAQSNPDAVRDILAEYTEIPPEVAQNIKLPQWRKDYDAADDRAAHSSASSTDSSRRSRTSTS